MRVWQFRKVVWQFDTVPYWEAKLSDANYMALAQHYGFETLLLDIMPKSRYFWQPVSMTGTRIPIFP